MSTYLETICTQEDMQSILPSLGEYNRNTVLTTWSIYSGNVYKSPSSGRVDMLYRDGNELTSVADLASVDSDGEYFYDSTNDVVSLLKSESDLLKINQKFVKFNTLELEKFIQINSSHS